MERHDHNVTTYHGIDTLDPMDVTREGKPLQGWSHHESSQY